VLPIFLNFVARKILPAKSEIDVAADMRQYKQNALRTNACKKIKYNVERKPTAVERTRNFKTLLTPSIYKKRSIDTKR